jgi:hypothetical protein
VDGFVDRYIARRVTLALAERVCAGQRGVAGWAAWDSNPELAD